MSGHLPSAGLAPGQGRGVGGCAGSFLINHHLLPQPVQGVGQGGGESSALWGGAGFVAEAALSPLQRGGLPFLPEATGNFE